MLIPNMIFILYTNWLLVQKARFIGWIRIFVARDLEKMCFLSKKAILEKKRCTLLFAFKCWFEWRMMIGEKFQNQGGDRFARGVAHFVEYLLLSKLCSTGILFFVTKKYMIRLSFWWWIQIYQIRKVTVNGRTQNLKFSQSNAIFLFFRCS